MTDILVLTGTAACFAGGVVALLYGMLRLRVPMWGFLILLVLPIVVLLSVSNVRNLYYEGLMHHSIVYEIFERGVPPENPLLASELLRYPYGHHLLIVGLMHVAPISPPWVFAATNVLSLILIAVVLDCIARLISPDRVFRVFAVLLALVGPSPFMHGPAREILISLGVPPEGNLIPLLKFTSVNSNQLGLLFAAVTLLGLAHIVAGKEQRKLAYGCVAAGILGAGLLYPLAWLAVGACTAAASVYMLFRRNHSLHISAGVVASILVLCSAAVLPFLLLVSAGKSGSSALHVLPSPLHLLRSGANLVLVLALPLVLAWTQREVLVKSFREKPYILGLLFLCTVITAVMFLSIFVPLQSAHKFFLVGLLPLGLLVAIPLRELYQTRKIVALATVFLIVFPIGWHFTEKIIFGWPVSDPAISDGRFLYHTDPAEDNLYTWITQHTPHDAVFVDTHLTIPPFARRQLLVGLDHRHERGEHNRERGELDKVWLNGWTMQPKLLLQSLAQLAQRRRERHELSKREPHDGWVGAENFVERLNGADPALLEMRRSIVDTLLSFDTGPISEQTLKQLACQAIGRPVYVVARHEAVRARLAEVKQMRPVYQGQAATVFRFRLECLGEG